MNLSLKTYIYSFSIYLIKLKFLLNYFAALQNWQFVVKLLLIYLSPFKCIFCHPFYFVYMFRLAVPTLEGVMETSDGITQDIKTLVNKLKTSPQSERQQLYHNLTLNISKNIEDCQTAAEKEDIEVVLSEILSDLKGEDQALVKFLLNQLDPLAKFFSSDQQKTILQTVITLIKASTNENVLLCFSHLETSLSIIKLENNVAEDLLNRISEILSNKTLPITLYTAGCTFVQRFFKEYEDKLSNFMSIVPKLIFLPLSHNAGKVREIAEKTLDSFPKSLLYSEDSVAGNVLLKLAKEQYCKDLLLLFKYKQELFVLKVWRNIVDILGKCLHSHLPTMTPFFQIIERGFKSSSDDVCKAAFLSWKNLICNFALDEAVLNDSKKLRFVLKPFKNISKCNETISLAACDTWWQLAWSLSHNLSSRFTEVCLPLLEFMLGRIANGSLEKTPTKGTHIFLAKRGCHFLLRLLEQPPNTAFNRISSPKKLPPVLFPALQVPLDVKIIIRHSKEIISMVRAVIEVFGDFRDMTSHLDCLLKSLLFVISAVVEDKNKESVDAVISLINLVTNITESKMCPPLTCLKCIESLSKLPRTTLVSHCFNCAPRKSQDILCTTLLKLLINPYLFTSEKSNKRYLMTYNRIIQTGLCESLNPLLMAQKYIHIVKTAVVSENTDGEALFEIWSGIASPLLEAIEKTQEVNQGDKQEHDFSCLYDVLLCPFEQNYPVSLNQIRARPAFKLWTNLYQTFIRCSALVPTTLPNEVCEHFCNRLKIYFKEESMKEPHYIETICALLEVVFESVDFTSITSVSSQGLSNSSMLQKRKKPLGNLTSLIDLLLMLLNTFYSNYIETDEDIYQSCAPKAQRKGQLSKTAIPLDLVKTFFGNLKAAYLIPAAIGEFSPPLSKFFSMSLKKCSNAIGSKLEVLWNVMTSCIEMHYLGPYDSDFLATMSPLLEICISHYRRNIKERSRRFWFATFASVASSLKMSDSMKNTLKKSRLSLVPEEISSLEDFSFTPGSGSEETDINVKSGIEIKHSFLKPFEVISSTETYVPEKPKEVKPAKQVSASIKRSVDELPSNEFVKIDSPCPSSLNPRRRSIRHKKSFVPALYNDLSQSQDTTTLGGSSESLDTTSSCEIMEFKTQEDTTDLPVLSQSGLNHEMDDTSLIITINTEDSNEPQEKLPTHLTVEEHNVTDSDCLEVNNSVEILISKKLVSEELEQSNKQGDDTTVTSKNNDIQHLNTEKDNIQNMGTENDNIQHLGTEKVNIQHMFTEKDKIKLSDSQKDVKSNSKPSIVKDRPQRMKQKKASNSEKDNPDLHNVNDDEKVDNDQVATVSSETNSAFDSPKVVEIKELTQNADVSKKALKLSQRLINKKLKSSKKLLITGPKKDLSKSFAAVDSGNSNFDASTAAKSNLLCPEVIDLSDSNEIIPSSQSSSDSGSHIKLQEFKPVAKSSGPRRAFVFEDLEDEKAEAPISIIVASQRDSDKEINVEGEKIDRSDIIPNSIGKDPSNVISQEVKSFSDDAIPMPLKSSENLLNCDELHNKSDGKDVKSVLSDIIMKTTENKKSSVAENTPPMYEEVCLLQTSQHVLLKDSKLIEAEGKTKSISDVVDCMITNDINTSNSGEILFKEESPKATKVKSLRSSVRNSIRVSLDGVSMKKPLGRPAKRKSMPAFIVESKKVKGETPETISSSSENNMVGSESLVSSNESVTCNLKKAPQNEIPKSKSFQNSPKLSKKRTRFTVDNTETVCDERLHSVTEEAASGELSSNGKELETEQENKFLELHKLSQDEEKISQKKCVHVENNDRSEDISCPEKPIVMCEENLIQCQVAVDPSQAEEKPPKRKKNSRVIAKKKGKCTEIVATSIEKTTNKSKSLKSELDEQMHKSESLPEEKMDLIDNSFLEEISSVISDIHEKIESYDESSAFDLSLVEGNGIEVDKNADMIREKNDEVSNHNDLEDIQVDKPIDDVNMGKCTGSDNKIEDDIELSDAQVELELPVAAPKDTLNLEIDTLIKDSKQNDLPENFLECNELLSMDQQTTVPDNYNSFVEGVMESSLVSEKDEIPSSSDSIKNSGLGLNETEEIGESVGENEDPSNFECESKRESFMEISERAVSEAEHSGNKEINVAELETLVDKRIDNIEEQNRLNNYQVEVGDEELLESLPENSSADASPDDGTKCLSLNGSLGDEFAEQGTVNKKGVELVTESTDSQNKCQMLQPDPESSDYSPLGTEADCQEDKTGEGNSETSFMESDDPETNDQYGNENEKGLRVFPEAQVAKFPEGETDVEENLSNTFTINEMDDFSRDQCINTIAAFEEVNLSPEVEVHKTISESTAEEAKLKIDTQKSFVSESIVGKFSEIGESLPCEMSEDVYDSVEEIPSTASLEIKDNISHMIGKEDLEENEYRDSEINESQDSEENQDLEKNGNQVMEQNEQCIRDIANDMVSAVTLENESILDEMDSSEAVELKYNETLNQSNNTEEMDTPDLLSCETFEEDSFHESNSDFDQHSPTDRITSIQNGSETGRTNREENSRKTKRKGQQPARSPFNLRQRSCIIVSMAKNPLVPSDTIDRKPARKTSQNEHKNSKSDMAGKKSKSVTIEMGDNTCTNIELRRTVDPAKRLKVEVNYDELTNVNTRLNASMTKQTRRFQMLKASAKALLSNEELLVLPLERDMSPEEVSSPKTANSILKKRKSTSELLSPKRRKVTFADPMVEERLFKSSDLIVTSVSSLTAANKVESNLSLRDNQKVEKVGEEMEEIPLSSDQLNCDNSSDYRNLSISPLLINCEESVNTLMKDLTSPEWMQGLKTLLLSKNIKTIGDLCRLNLEELKALPLKSPKVLSVHKALQEHLHHTQEATLEKLTSVDNWCSSKASTEVKMDDACDQNTQMEDSMDSKMVHDLAQELLEDDKLKLLPTQMLISLSRKCFKEMTERLQNSQSESQ